MATRSSFVPVLVITSDSSHQLLRLHFEALFQFVREVARFPTAKGCGHPTMMQDLNVTVLPPSMSEAEISFEGLLHGTPR